MAFACSGHDTVAVALGVSPPTAYTANHGTCNIGLYHIQNVHEAHVPTTDVIFPAQANKQRLNSSLVPVQPLPSPLQQKPKPLPLGLLVPHPRAHHLPLDLRAYIQLLVQPHQQHPQRRRRRNAHEGGPAIHAHRNDISRRKGCLIHIAGVDARSVAYGVDSGESGGAFSRRARDAVRNPGKRDDEAGVEGARHEHDGEIAGGEGGGGAGEDEGDEGDDERAGDVEVAFAGAVGVPGVEVGGEDGEDVGRHGEEEGVDVVVAEGLDDGGEEVGDAAGGDDAGFDEEEEVGLGVGEGELEAVEEGLLL